VTAVLFLAAPAAPNGKRAAAPAVLLEFDVKTTQLAEVVARAQARLDAFGATRARAMQQAGRLVVKLPASIASRRSEIEVLLTRPHELAFTIVENNSPLMIDLGGRSEGDPRSHELGIFHEIASWQRNDATHGVESDPFLEGQRQALEQYLAGLDVARQPDRDHAFRLSPVPDRSKVWRTEYVDLRTRVRITRALEASVEPNNLRGDDSIELVLRLLPADGERLRVLTGGHLGKKLAITVDDEVLSTPVIESAVGGRDRMPMSDEPLARRLAAALLGGPLLAPLTLRTGNDPRARPSHTTP
jgi:preprotein translocase subunit SecD